jgi:arylsulfatase A-like enzyme
LRPLRERRPLLLVACLMTLVPGMAGAAEAKRPNVVFLLADDLGWGDVGWHGGEIKTPNLDKLAAAGAKLEAFYVQPVCSPTRAALMTGRYPMRHGLQVGVVRPWAQYGLPLEERTLAQGLKEAGYATAIGGKAPRTLQPRVPADARGFDNQYGHYNGAAGLLTHIRDGGFDWHRDDKVCRDEGYATHSWRRRRCACRGARRQEAVLPLRPVQRRPRSASGARGVHEALRQSQGRATAVRRHARGDG